MKFQAFFVYANAFVDTGVYQEVAMELQRRITEIKWFLKTKQKKF